MQCPACDIALVVVERDEIEVDWCLECRGIWFDSGELALLGEKAGRTIEIDALDAVDAVDALDAMVGPTRRPASDASSEDPTGGTRRCPRCPRTMERVGLDVPARSSAASVAKTDDMAGGVVEIDRCRDHGFWLDHGELALLVNRARNDGGSDRALVLDFLCDTFAADARSDERHADNGGNG